MYLEAPVLLKRGKAKGIVVPYISDYKVPYIRDKFLI